MYITWTCFFLKKTPHLSSTALVFQHPTIGRCKRFVKTSRTSILMSGRLLQTRAMMKIVGAPSIDCLEIRQIIVGAQRGTGMMFLLVEFLRNQWFNWSRFRIWHPHCNICQYVLLQKKGPCGDWRLLNLTHQSMANMKIRCVLFILCHLCRFLSLTFAIQINHSWRWKIPVPWMVWVWIHFIHIEALLLPGPS